MNPISKQVFQLLEGDKYSYRSRHLPLKEFNLYAPHMQVDFDLKYQMRFEEILDKHAKEQDRVVKLMQENSQRRKNIEKQTQRRLDKMKAEDDQTLAQLRENKRFAYLRYLKQQDHHSIIDTFEDSYRKKHPYLRKRSPDNNAEIGVNKLPASSSRKNFDLYSRGSNQGTDTSFQDYLTSNSSRKENKNGLLHVPQKNAGSPKRKNMYYGLSTEVEEKSVPYKPSVGASYATENNEDQSVDDWMQWYNSNMRKGPDLRPIKGTGEQKAQSSDVRRRNVGVLSAIQSKKTILETSLNGRPSGERGNSLNRYRITSKTPQKPANIEHNNSRLDSGKRKDDIFSIFRPQKPNVNRSFDVLKFSKQGFGEDEDSLIGFGDVGNQSEFRVDSEMLPSVFPRKRPTAGARKKRINSQDMFEYSGFNEAEMIASGGSGNIEIVEGDIYNDFDESPSLRKFNDSPQHKMIPNLSFGPQKFNQENPLLAQNNQQQAGSEGPLHPGIQDIRNKDSLEILKGIEDNKSRLSTCEDSPVRLFSGKVRAHRYQPTEKQNKGFSLGLTPFEFEESSNLSNRLSPKFNTEGVDFNKNQQDEKKIEEKEEKKEEEVNKLPTIEEEERRISVVELINPERTDLATAILVTEKTEELEDDKQTPRIKSLNELNFEESTDSSVEIKKIEPLAEIIPLERETQDTAVQTEIEEDEDFTSNTIFQFKE